MIDVVCTVKLFLSLMLITAVFVGYMCVNDYRKGK